MVDVDDVHAIYRVVLIEVLALSYAVRPPRALRSAEERVLRVVAPKVRGAFRACTRGDARRTGKNRSSRDPEAETSTALGAAQQRSRPRALLTIARQSASPSPMPLALV